MQDLEKVRDGCKATLFYSWTGRSVTHFVGVTPLIGELIMVLFSPHFQAKFYFSATRKAEMSLATCNASLQQLRDQGRTGSAATEERIQRLENLVSDIERRLMDAEGVLSEQLECGSVPLQPEKHMPAHVSQQPTLPHVVTTL